MVGSGHDTGIMNNDRLPGFSILDGSAAVGDSTAPSGDGDAPEAPAATLCSVELMGTQLRTVGTVDIGRFARLSDYVIHLDGFFTLLDVVLLTRTGEPTRITLPELRVRFDEIAIVGQKEAERRPMAPERFIPKKPRRLLVMTSAHIIYGNAYLHEQASVAAFVDATDPAFMPMTNVRVRWLADRRLAGRYPFAMIHRTHIIGVATDVSGGIGLLKGRSADDALDSALEAIVKPA